VLVLVKRGRGSQGRRLIGLRINLINFIREYQSSEERMTDFQKEFLIFEPQRYIFIS